MNSRCLLRWYRPRYVAYVSAEEKLNTWRVGGRELCLLRWGGFGAHLNGQGCAVWDLPSPAFSQSENSSDHFWNLQSFLGGRGMRSLWSCVLLLKGDPLLEEP